LRTKAEKEINSEEEEVKHGENKSPALRNKK
jgi:hypothetical protein